MGKHAANKTLVVEAKLFGAYQRRIDLAVQAERGDARAGQADIEENRVTVAELERELEALGGDPAEVLAVVRDRGTNVGKPGGRPAE